MSDRRFWRILALIVLVAAAARVTHIISIRGTPLWHFAESWVTSDMYANLKWADHVAAGDWLDRETWRPHFAWQDRVASPEVWNRWLGPTTYYQPPLYTYLLAFIIRGTGSPDFFRLLQALLGAINVGLVGILGWRLASAGAGLVAAALAALYAPWILYDAELLRGTLAITFSLLSLLALERASTGSSTEGRGWGAHRGWILSGIVLGAAYLADSSVVTFLPLAGLWILLGAGDGSGPIVARMRRALPRLAWLAAGMAAALSPLLARNLSLGAPPLAVTTRAPLAFVMGNAPDAMPVGASIPESAPAILNASEYRTLPTILETFKAHRNGLTGILGLQWRKLEGVFNSHEVPDNPSFDYASLYSPVLRYGLRFSCVIGLGLVGMLLAVRRARAMSLLYLHAAAAVAIFAAAQVVSRYRQPLLIALFVFSGFAVMESVRRWGARPIAALSLMAGAVALSFAMPSNPPPGYRVHRAAEFVAASAWHEGEGDPRAGREEIMKAIDFSWKEAGPSEERIMLGMELTAMCLRHGMYPQALSALGNVLDEDPGNALALATRGAIHQDTSQPWQALRDLVMAAVADPKNPEVHARLGHLYWFVYESPAKALVHLRRALELAPAAPAAVKVQALIDEIAASPAAVRPDPS